MSDVGYNVETEKRDVRPYSDVMVVPMDGSSLDWLRSRFGFL